MYPMEHFTQIADAWLPHEMNTVDGLRLPIQSIRVKIKKERTALRFPRREECLIDYKGLPFTIYFRRRTAGFMISMQ